MHFNKTPSNGDSNVITILAGYYQSIILLNFLRAGVFELLQNPITAQDLSVRVGWRYGKLRACLDFLAETTDFIRRDGRQRYHASYSVRQLRGLEFQVEKFAGAYGKTVRQLPDILTSKDELGKRTVDSRSLARAFAAGAAESRGMVTAFIVAARPKRLLDLGCGSGSLLVQLAKIDPEFRGIGIDSSRLMCTLARQHISRLSLQARIQIRKLDAREVERLPDADSLHAGSLMNEMFQSGSGEAVDYLKRLKRRYKGRDLWIVDYYARLGLNSGADLHTLLHDLVQVLSGQGLPPKDIRQWRSIYKASNCHLREVHEFSDSGIRWFVHRLRL